MRETEILVEQQPPQGVFVCDHAGLLINNFSQRQNAQQTKGIAMMTIIIQIESAGAAGLGVVVTSPATTRLVRFSAISAVPAMT